MTPRHRLATVVAVAGLVLLLSPPGGAHADSIRDREWIISALSLTKAHQLSEGAGVVVAVVDSGVDATHADLAGNVLAGADLSSDGSPRDNGHADTVGHGTGIAGIIAAHGHGSHDADGVLGIAPRAKILPVKDGDEFGFQITPAVEWATKHGAKVICLAVADVLSEPPRDLQRAIEAAERADIVVVAAAGNLPTDTTVRYPAAYPGVVAAAGTDEHGNHAAVSVTGPQVVLAAPATNMVQPYPDHRYAEGTGTSVSTAIIAGAAALVRSRFPKLSAAEVIHRLTATAIDKGAPGRDDEYGYGLINIVAALTANVPPAGPSAAPSTPQASPTITAPPSVPTQTPSTTVAAAKSSNAGAIGVIAAVAALFAVLAVWLVARRANRRRS